MPDDSLKLPLLPNQKKNCFGHDAPVSPKQVEDIIKKNEISERNIMVNNINIILIRNAHKKEMIIYDRNIKNKSLFNLVKKDFYDCGWNINLYEPNSIIDYIKYLFIGDKYIITKREERNASDSDE